GSTLGLPGANARRRWTGSCAAVRDGPGVAQASVAEGRGASMLKGQRGAKTRRRRTGAFAAVRAGPGVARGPVCQAAGSRVWTNRGSSWSQADAAALEARDVRVSAA